MRSWAVLALGLSCLCVPTTTADELLLPLRVLYIGNGKTPRPGHFTAFLKKHFKQVTVADREKFEAPMARSADVVLFDWSQSDSNMAKTPVPFGRLEDWSKPTVLLNSAGLLVAARWQLIGGSG
jgi:hypothetical protein